MAELDNPPSESLPPSPVKAKGVGIVKEQKAGIIYLSTVPPKMNVKQIREYLGQFGEVGRSFLQPEKKKWKGKQRNQTFTEGWIEFKKRRHAKRVAVNLNNTAVGGKKTKAYHDFLWNIKYLPGFQWVHLNERLAYERISMKQKIRTEISAAKRETDFFSKNVDLSTKLKRKGVLGGNKKRSFSGAQQGVDEAAQVESPKSDIPMDTSSPSQSQPLDRSVNVNSAKSSQQRKTPKGGGRVGIDRLKSLFRR